MSYALITGASKGIGKEIAAELASRKYNLLLVARSEELLQKVASELKSRYKVEVDYLAIDLAQIGVAQQVFDWVNTKKYEVSILVNNAGYGLVDY
jgi:short-subunit dehydrogenase